MSLNEDVPGARGVPRHSAPRRGGQKGIDAARHEERRNEIGSKRVVSPHLEHFIAVAPWLPFRYTAIVCPQ